MKKNVYDRDAFEYRVQFATQRILSGGETTRHFDSCFEMCDGTVVVEAIRRRALKNPKLMAVVHRYLAPHSFVSAEEEYGHLDRRELKNAAREARESFQRRYLSPEVSV